MLKKETADKLFKLLNVLEDNEDVQDVSHQILKLVMKFYKRLAQ